MAIEIRILSGAHAGQIMRFEQPVVVVGRQSGLDLRFDPQQDLDVSSRHAELRTTEEGYAVLDLGSTNGTFVNGKKVSGKATLKPGDKVKFGANGPEAEVQFALDAAKPATITPRTTEQRIAIAVSRQTAGLKRILIAALILVVVAGGGTVFYLRRQTTLRTEEFNKLVADNDRMRITLQSSMRSSGDTALMNAIQRRDAELHQRLAQAATGDDSAQIKTEIQANQEQLRRMVQMDLPTIFKQNSSGVAILMTDIGGKYYTGTGFSISKEGHIITNKHNVTLDGKIASRILVKFTDTRAWVPASLVKMSDNDDDIALIKLDGQGPYPTVSGVSAASADVAEGMSIVSIGYPLGRDTPQEGDGLDDFMAKATLNPGTVSKKTSSVLQIDSFATHGSSGSPVFSTRGYVVGLVYGGAREAGGNIVYAVPPEKVAAFIPANLRAIVKD